MQDEPGEWLLKDKVCIVGIGETKYYRWGRSPVSEFHLACEAILKAVDDSGLRIQDIDGICSFAFDRNQAEPLAVTLGIPRLRLANMFFSAAGAGACGPFLIAAMAIVTGSANNVVVFRSMAQGQFGRFGRSSATARVGGTSAFTAPYGIMSAAQTWAMHTRRHMALYGTTSRQLGAISVAAYKHAQRNPNAVMYGRPITIEDHQNSRMIADPFHLFDCCQENDGACALVVTSAERARNLKQRPVYIMAAAQGCSYRSATGGSSLYNSPDFPSSGFREVAKELYKRAGIGPKDIDVAQIYENFTGPALMSIEDHGFCKIGEGGPFVEGGRIEWPDGELPINTSGGNLAEAYIHGLEFAVEGVRQMRGTSNCQVAKKGRQAEICLVAAGPGGGLTSDMILRR